MKGSALSDMVAVGGGPASALVANLLDQAEPSVRAIMREPASNKPARPVHVEQRSSHVGSARRRRRSSLQQPTCFVVFGTDHWYVGRDLLASAATRKTPQLFGESCLAVGADASGARN